MEPEKGGVMPNPTASQKRLWAKMAEFGCLACYLDEKEGTPATIHHCHNYGYRDHDKTIPLCPQHHQHQFAVPERPNREKNPIEFEQRYGSDSDLYYLMMDLLRCKHPTKPKGYLEWHEWADKKSKRHVQVLCAKCGKLVWRRK